MANYLMQHSFASGELSPQIAARTDLSKYHTGAAKIRNFVVDFRGGVFNRPGTKFIGFAKATGYQPRLIKFQFSTLQGYILEFGHQYMRVIMDGGYVLESAKTVTGYASGTFTVASHGYAVGDTVYLDDAGALGNFNKCLAEVTAVTTNTFTVAFQNSVSLPTGTSSGGTVARVYTLTTPWSGADVHALNYAQSADVITLCHTGYVPYDITRTGHAAWTCTAVSFASTIAAPATPSLTYTGDATYTTTFGYVVTAVSSSGEESIASNVATTTCGNIATVEGSIKISWAQSSGALYYNIYKCITDKSGTISPGVTFGWVGSSYGTTFTDNNITASFTKTPPFHSDPFAPGAISKFTITNGGSGYSASTTATLTDATGSGAVITPIIISGVILGFYVVNRGSNYTAPTITLGSVGGGTGFAGTVTVGPTSGTYPGCVSYFQQRKVYAASTNQPTTLWATRPANFKNMDVSIPTNDGDSYSFTLASTEVNAIKSLVSMAEGMLVLTAGGVWQLVGASSTVVTPSSAVAKIQSYEGSTALTPIAINHDVLYVQARGAIVRGLSYNFYASVYTGQDLTVLSAHLFNGHTISAWAYAAEPHKLIYCVRDDGKMLVLTYLKEQEIVGWSTSDTDGIYKDVATIQEGTEDAVYFIVKRKLNGRWLHCVERQATRVFKGPDDYWFSDCAVAYTPSPIAAELYSSAIDGADVTFTASAPVFSYGDVGSVIRANGGVATITAYVSATEVTGAFSYPMTEVITADGVDAPKVAESGTWTLGAPITEVGGLAHLEGEAVAVLADGDVVTGLTVTNASITLPRAASYVIVGKQYISQLKTLEVDSGLPTIQGKRKKLNKVIFRVESGRGLYGGTSFDTLTEVKFTKSNDSDLPPDVYSGDWVHTVNGQYGTSAFVCAQQSYPLPVRILGVIFDITLGE